VIGADLFYEENTTIWSGRMMLIYSEIKIPLTDYTNKQSCRFKKKTNKAVMEMHCRNGHYEQI
jgi:hypothetical protein